MSAYTDFLSDQRARHVWLFEVTARNVAENTTATYYFSSDRYATAATDSPASQRYDALIVRGFEMSSEMEGGGTTLAGLMPARVGGSIVLGQKMGDLDLGTLTQLAGVSIRDLSFGGLSAKVRHGGRSPRLGRWLTYSEFKVVFDGTCDGNPQIGADDVTFRLATKDRNFDFPIQSRTFMGLGYALHFDGTNDEVSATAGSTTELDFTSGDFTAEFPMFYEANPAAVKTIVSRGSNNTDGWVIEQDTAGLIGLRTYQAGASQITQAASAPTTSRWVWVSVRRNGANVQIYYDGIVVTGTPATHIDPVTASRTFYLARNNGGTQFWNGLIGELRVWNVLRTTAEINATMSRPLDSTEIVSSLVLYWALDEGTGTPAADTSANDATGTITGATWIHSGTGHLEMAGEKLPDIWGPVYGWAPTLLDEVRRIYFVSAEQVQAIDRVDVGASANMILENAETSFLTFITSTTANGKYDTCNTSGGTYLRLGSSPSKPLTLDVRGNAPGGTYLNLPGAQIRYIVCNRGPNPLVDPTDLDTTSFTDLDTDCPVGVGHAWDGDTSISEVLDFICRTVGAVAWFRRASGLLAVERNEGVAAKTATVTLTERDVARDSLEVLDRSTPVGEVIVHFKRNYTVLGSGDLLPGVAGTDREKFVKREWRDARFKSNQVVADYKDAATIEIETGLITTSAATNEAVRLGQLFDEPDQAFRFLCRQRGVELDRMDAAYFHYQDRDRFNRKQSRFGTSDSAKFLVLEASDDVESGGTWLTLWREAT